MNSYGSFILLTLFGFLLIAVIGLGNAFGPLLFAFCLAYLLFPLIHKIERFGIKRHFTVSIIFFIFTLIGILIISFGLPVIIVQTQNLLHELPQNIAILVDKAEDLSQNYGYNLNINKETLKLFIFEHTSQISGTLINGVSNTFKSLFTSALNWFLTILNLFLIPLFFFYLINDFEKLSQQIKKLIPPIWLPKFVHYLQLSNQVLSGYLRGQILVACIMSFLYGIGLWLIDLRFGFLIGFMTGVLGVIPYVGSTIGLITALIFAITNYNGLGTFIGIILVFIIIQTLEGTIITPRLVGNKVGLNALSTLLALIIGGNLFGLLGMLIAIPVTAVLKNITKDLIIEYRQLNFYNQQ